MKGKDMNEAKKDIVNDKKLTRTGRLMGELARCHARAYSMRRLAVQRRHRVMTLLNELSFVKSLAWASFAMNVGMAIVIVVIAASKN